MPFLLKQKKDQCTPKPFFDEYKGIAAINVESTPHKIGGFPPIHQEFWRSFPKTIALQGVPARLFQRRKPTDLVVLVKALENDGENSMRESIDDELFSTFFAFGKKYSQQV